MGILKELFAMTITCNDFKIGDTVVLDSGGPDMKVIGHSPHGTIWCSWKKGVLDSGEDYFGEASFPPESLTKLSGENSAS